MLKVQPVRLHHPKALKVQKDPLVHLLKELKVQKVLPAQLVPRDQQALKDPPVLPAQRVQKDHKVD